MPWRYDVAGIAMIGLDLPLFAPATPDIAGERVVLRPPQLADFDGWRALREESRAHLTRWEPDWRAADVTAEAWKLRLKFYARDARAGSGYAWLVTRAADGRMIGGVTLSDVRAMPLASATIGYWIGAAFLRSGFGLAAVRAVVAHAAGPLRLHRVEAACQPENEASRRLLARAGFAEEGLACGYLHINGAWRDHIRFARLCA